MILGPFEAAFLRELKGLKIPENPELADLLQSPMDGNTQEQLDSAFRKNQRLTKIGRAAYQSFLGYYLGQMKRIQMKQKDTLVGVANDMSEQMRLDQVPGLTARLVGKMGLKGVRGIRIEEVSNSGGSHHQGNGPGRQQRGHSNQGSRGGQRRR